MPTAPTINIPKSAEWYVRSGLDRALRLTRQQIEQIDKRIQSLTKKQAELKNLSQAKDLEFVTEFLKEAEGIKAYYAQWLTEATEVYQTLPREIRPFID